jgi:FkbM family methyltransferase
MDKSTKRPTAFVTVSTNHGSMLVNRHDYRLVEDGGYGVGFQLLNTSSFDQEEVDIALKLLNTRRQHFGDGVVAIDCGANIGVHTIEWARFMYGWGEVVAFEAQERVYYALCGNITMNNCFNAHAVWAAVGAENGQIAVPVPDYFTPSSFGSLELRQRDGNEFIGQAVDYSPEKTKPTPLLALDGLDMHRLDFMKIDIEGMEMEALSGARNQIARFKPQMLIEKIKSNEAEIGAFLADLGYKTFPLGLNLLAVHESDPVAGEIHIG